MRTQPDVDSPIPLTACWLHWIAVSTGDQAGVMETMGLTDPRPITFAAAADLIDSDAHDREPEGVGRVYVSPALDGWTLVIGRWCDPTDPDRSDEVRRLCTRLSSRYGHAHAFYYGEQGDGSAWLVTERGAVLRSYCGIGEDEDELLTFGEPLPYELARRERLGLPPLGEAGAGDDGAEDEWEWEVAAMAPKLAAALGVSPLELGAETPVHGTGLLARTPSP
ncbi:hypothetical protein AB0A77_00350 [Streptomyces varsoviensis]|uniref:hypothetical protein n=1 Tax=Streptomyces varsoviensis TaxID=67373 RepID=UPI0033E6AF8C